MDKRKRFEVFKRDKFTCQYCGKKAPDVILEVDHICPVSKGGTDDLINLVTSCRDCNRGKSNIELSDDSRVLKERRQLLEMAEKQEQVEMMVEWKRKLQEKENHEVDLINDELYRLTSSRVSLSPTGRKNCYKLIKKYGFQTVLDALYKAVNFYYRPEIENSGEYVFQKVYGICYFSQKEDDRSWYYYNYLKKAMINKDWYCDKNILRERVFDYIADDEDFEEAKSCLHKADDWVEFWEDFIGYD